MKIPKRRLRYLPPPKVKKKGEYDNYSNDPFYNQRRWRRLRKQLLNINPLCVYCNIARSADTIDHLRPRRLWPELEWDEGNLISCCRQCHTFKTNRENHCKTQEEWEKNMKGYLLRVENFYTNL